MSLRPIAIALLIVGALVAAPAAWAEDEEPQSLEDKIKQKMERILQLMRQNEKALLKLSAGIEAETKRVDVPVPDGQQGKGKGKGAESGSESAGSSGKKATEELERLMKSSRSEGGKIPDELKQLVEMIPL